VGPTADLPSDAEPVDPARKRARKARAEGAEAGSASESRLAAKKAPVKKAAAKKAAATKAPAKKAPAEKSASATSPREARAPDQGPSGSPSRAAAKKGPAKKAPVKKAAAKKAAPGRPPAKSGSTRKAAPRKGSPTTAVPEAAAPDAETLEALASELSSLASTDSAATAPSPEDAPSPAGPPDSAPSPAAEPEEPEPAASRRGRKRGGRFRRAELLSKPTTSDIPRPARDPRRIQQRVAVIIPAKDEARRIAATVRAAKSIPQVDLVLVVDDGSQDNTQHLAREAGAVVVRHSHNRGKAAAMETGAAVVAMRDTPERPPRLLLFIDADLGETAVNTAPLIPPVAEHAADFSIALLPPQKGAGGRGLVVSAARKGIARLTGWAPTQPLSGMRCLTRAAFEAATPLARGWGVETGMTIDLLRQGYVAVEVPCDLRHRPSGNDLGGQLHRAAQYRDVQLAISARTVRGAAQAVKRAVTPQKH